MTEETIRELWREHDACILRARELGEVELRLRREWMELRNQMEESLDAIRERERAASNARSECTRIAGLISRVLEEYDERIQWH